MTDDRWTMPAGRELRGLRGPLGAWGYRTGAAPYAEPTALAALALLSTREGMQAFSDVEIFTRSADWLAAAQRPDGSIGVGTSTSNGGWMTPYALLLWNALGSHQDQRRRAVGWLLKLKGRTLDPREDPLKIAGHDTTLVGWPWVDDTHSWLEPTCLAILALTGEGYASHPRVVEGLRLVRNRALDAGGWNYGNKSVFGRELRAQPAPTGLALLTLAGIDKETPIISNAIRYLQLTLPNVRAAASLGWGVLGLRAWGKVPAPADRWLEESYRSAHGRPDAARKLACLLLAAGPASLRLFGRSGSDRAGIVDSGAPK